jgi:hypothetical protein
MLNAFDGRPDPSKARSSRYVVGAEGLEPPTSSL